MKHAIKLFCSHSQLFKKLIIVPEILKLAFSETLTVKVHLHIILPVFR